MPIFMLAPTTDTTPPHPTPDRPRPLRAAYTRCTRCRPARITHARSRASFLCTIIWIFFLSDWVSAISVATSSSHHYHTCRTSPSVILYLL
ncbi:hypothetical protein C8J57DRAFT_1130864 [Mycena rebaudengoi]|nr:hypothetical protein C8J57DRAFT_1130864 [Mycena rebaudengoi]